MSNSESSPKKAEAEVQAQAAGKESNLQTTGPCIFKERCIVPGKTLYVCTTCRSRFHHLCASEVGKSDDMNICSADCIAGPSSIPPANTDKSKDKRKSSLDDVNAFKVT